MEEYPYSGMKTWDISDDHIIVLVKGAELQVENQGCWGFPQR